ncbi:hypothetical protein CR513_51409, partial [Mucuna pruriens]
MLEFRPSMCIMVHSGLVISTSIRHLHDLCYETLEPNFIEDFLFFQESSLRCENHHHWPLRPTS